MWCFWVLFWLSFAMDSCAVRVGILKVQYGTQLSLKLKKETTSLEFSSVYETEKFVIWPSSMKHKSGLVTGQNSDRRYIVNSATFDDGGNYTQRNSWKSVVDIVTVRIVPSIMKKEHVAGETLRIPLRGLTSKQATLNFYSQDLNLTLVNLGLPVGNTHPDYYERIIVNADTIQVLHVNMSDVGNYTLRDDQGRMVFVVSLELVDKHKTLSPLVALMLLLGIPVGICCCCRKKLFKKSSQSTTTTILQSGTLVPPPGPPPSYSTVVVPAVPGPINTPAYPVPGESTVHPPPNPAFPPQAFYGGQPAMPPNPGIISGYSHENPAYPVAPGFPPAQPSQLNASSYGPPAPTNMAAYPPPGLNEVHLPPNPAFPPEAYYGGQPAMPNPGLAPVMFHAPAGPASVTAEMNMNEMSPATPLLPPSQPEVRQGSYTSADILNSDSAVQFNINTGKDTTSNFL
ncbi:uncharacterized protein LOC143476057 [Brachyhypopomus gauderio]|uniref:uncharacterized protein LOC143476057 n=1 Tax=Brachyhypopomus gauderio TaxID=698409 RepID=UPI0040434C3F